MLSKIIVVSQFLNLFGLAGSNSDLGRYGLWPGLISLESQRHGTNLPGMIQVSKLSILTFSGVNFIIIIVNDFINLNVYEAIHKIWTIQHPVSCKSAKYLIYDGIGGGHGGTMKISFCP